MIKKAETTRKNDPREKSQTKSKSKNAKPIFPAYAPSHLDVINNDNRRISNEHESNKHLETNQLYVTNLPPNTNMQEMSKMFPECVSIALGVNDKDESPAAYVEFQDKDATQKVCQRTRGASLRGNTLIISPKLKYN